MRFKAFLPVVALLAGLSFAVAPALAQTSAQPTVKKERTVKQKSAQKKATAASTQKAKKGEARPTAQKSNQKKATKAASAKAKAKPKQAKATS
jgi:hypothetical protein